MSQDRDMSYRLSLAIRLKFSLQMTLGSVSAIAAVCTTRISLDWRDDLDSTVGDATGAAKRRFVAERSDSLHKHTILRFLGTPYIHSFDLCRVGRRSIGTEP